MRMRCVSRSVLVLAIVASAHVARAQPKPEHGPWYSGPRGHRRVLHLAIDTSIGLAFLASNTVFKNDLIPSSCRWCEPPGFDRSVRNALVWDNKERANVASSITAFVVEPAIGLGLLILSNSDTSWSRLIDDTLPVFEAVVVSQLVTQAVKFGVGRQRPYAHFDPASQGSTEDNLSFWSGHSELAFAVTASAGMICHWRHYKTEPYVWAAGITLSLTTEYLRIAADKHYLSDVMVGGLVGLASGLTIPRLARRDLAIVPIDHGAAVVGQF